MFNRKLALNLMAATLLATSLVGCGSSPAAPDPGLSDPNSDPNASYGAPSTGTTAPAYGAPATGQYGSTGAAAAPQPDLTAAVTKKKGGLFSKFTCTVEVTNSGSVQRTGTLTVTFMHGSKPESGSPPFVQTVTIPANGSQSFDIKDPKYHLLSEDAKAEVTTDPLPAAAAAAPAAGAYGAAPGAYGAAAPTGY